MYEELAQLLYEIAALRYSLKNLHYKSRYARHLLADRLSEGNDDDNADEIAIQNIVDSFQETFFNGAGMAAIPEEDIADNCRKWIVPAFNTSNEQIVALMHAFAHCNENIARIFPRQDIANQKFLGDIAYSFKHAYGMLWREVYGNNEYTD